MKHDFLSELGIHDDNPGAYCGEWLETSGGSLEVQSPNNGEVFATVQKASPEDYTRVSAAAGEAFLRWREITAPARGEYVRRIGLALREKKELLGRLVALEAGKILQEGWGEVQECIDIADFAVGLSRQLYGLTMPSERPQHSMRETWLPLGTVGIITAFNFPAAVWSWNAMIALVCGDSCLWKPSSKTPLTALAMTRVAAEVLEPDGFGALVSLVVGDGRSTGEAMLNDRSVPLISATGSVRMGRHVGQKVAERLGRSLLELGGNNAIIVLEDADLEMATRAIVFGAVGTAGQRCTSTRRILADKKIFDALQDRLVAAYQQVRIGNAMDEGTLMGPLIDGTAVEQMMQALEEVREQGGEIVCGGKRAEVPAQIAGGHYVLPTIVRAVPDMPIVQEETFAPVLYMIPIEGIDQAIELQNGVPQGLSSSIFTLDVRKAERFLSATGSDCGIANVNIGTSGAEIGGAFGGEKETGGGRESGSDSWKVYMRRQTSTINWGNELPLAQGIVFGD